MVLVSSNWSGTSRARPEIGLKEGLYPLENDGRSWYSGLSTSEATTNA